MFLIAEDDISVKQNLGHFALLMWLSMGGMALIKTLLVSCPKHYDFFGENNTELQKTVSVFKVEVKLCSLRANVNNALLNIFVSMFNRKRLPMKLFMCANII